MENKFEKKRLEFQVKLALKELREKGIRLDESTGQWGWDDCIAKMMEEYGDEDIANNVCGALKRDYGI